MITESGVLEYEVTVAAPPEVVFDYFVDPDKIVQWMGNAATLDARAGGIFRLEYKQDTARGEFVEVDRPRRVIFTWGWEDPGDAVQPGASTVEVDLEPDGDSTRVRIRHLGLDEASQKTHEEGWVYFMPRLVEAVEGVAAAAG